MHAPVPICRWLARVLTSIAVAAAGGAQAGAPRGGPAATSAGAGVLATRAGPRPWSVVVEDDGRVAYAYLLRDGKIATDAPSLRRNRFTTTARSRRSGTRPGAR
jgi:hypothetical protein